MIWSDELPASLDQIDGVIVFHRTEQTRVQQLAQELANKVSLRVLCMSQELIFLSRLRHWWNKTKRHWTSSLDPGRNERMVDVIEARVKVAEAAESEEAEVSLLSTCGTHHADSIIQEDTVAEAKHAEDSRRDWAQRSKLDRSVDSVLHHTK